ncbi:MAG: response regulator [Anaerolineae bacterium]|nr:response regulator [Anaerolineae bacterium]
MIPKILICDDDEAIRQRLVHVLQTAFAREGRQVQFLQAVNGQQALDIIARELITLLVIDAQLPEIDGYQATTLLKSDPATAAIPVILLSRAEDVQRVTEAGANRIFDKPVPEDQLVLGVFDLLG